VARSADLHSNGFGRQRRENWAGHAAHLTRDLVRVWLDLSAIMDAYSDVKGYRPYHPAMVAVLI
jgi:hypothetical protein